MVAALRSSFPVLVVDLREKSSRSLARFFFIKILTLALRDREKFWARLVGKSIEKTVPEGQVRQAPGKLKIPK